MTVVSVAVMAHPSRARMVDELVARLGGPATVVWDRISNEWDTAKRALLAYDPAADYHLVVQDDALACRGLRAGLALALSTGPDELRAVPAVVSLYAGETRRGPFSRAFTAAAAGESPWLLASRLWWGVAAAYPVPLIDGLVAGCDRIAVREYDRRVSSWLRRKAVPIVYTVPSLVDHRDEPSLLHHDAGGLFERHAAWFAGAESSALDVDWSRPAIVVTDPRAPGQQVRRISNRPTVTRR